MNEEIIQKTEEYVREHVPTKRKPDEKYFDHVFGARKYALKLAKEYHADEFIVDMAILLHDIGADAGPIHAQKSAEIAEEYLGGLNIDEKTKDEIVKCIRTHSMGIKVDSLEQQIIQDADGLIFIDDSYKYFFEKQKDKASSLEEALRRSVSKTDGMTAKIKTKMGIELKNELLPIAIEWLNSQKH